MNDFLVFCQVDIVIRPGLVTLSWFSLNLTKFFTEFRSAIVELSRLITAVRLYIHIKKHSTTHPVLQLIKDIADANDKNTKDATLASFIDLSKAFDTINHDIMLHKLQFYGIRGICNSWFANYLSNRKQLTEIGNSKSSHKYLTTGVPQGSILGPILFLIYIKGKRGSRFFFPDDFESSPYPLRRYITQALT